MIRRMKVNRLAWAVPTCLVAAFAVSCGGGDGENRSVSGERSRVTPAASSASPSCSKASIRWGKVTVGTKLIAVSQLVTVEDGQELGRVKLAPPRADRDVPYRGERWQRADGARPRLLEKRLGYDSPTFRRPGKSTSARLEKDGLGSIDFLGHPGRFLVAAGVRVVEASFALDCSGSADTPIHGSLTSWYGSSGASMKCGIVPEKGKWFREAYDLVCPGAHS